MNTIIFIILVLFTIKLLNYYRASIINLKAENKLVSLKNNLRLKAIYGDIDSKSINFIHLDESISISLKCISQISVFDLIYFYYTNRKEINNLTTPPKGKSDKYKGVELVTKYELEFKDILINHFIYKNIVSIIFFLLPILIIKFIRDLFTGFIARNNIKVWYKYIYERIKSVIIASEMKSEYQYC